MRARLALPALLGVAAPVTLVLIALASGYGYHRDELYFLAAGDHLAWAYPDQGLVTPLIAHLMNAIAPGSLTVLRVPSALMAGAIVVLAGATAHELGARRRAQLIAAGCTAVASVVLFDGHLLSTSTPDLLAWALLTWLVVRAIRGGEERLWLAAGLVAGVALENKPLVAFLLAAIGAGLLVAGPRQVLRSAWTWGGLALAALLWSPWLVWQAQHGWPQLTVSASVAHGGSTSSQPRWALVPFQLLLVSPVLAPVWIAGLVALARRPRLRPYRFLAVAWLLLVLAFEATGGKPYYLAGMFPLLLAAGAIETDVWLERGSARLRRRLLAGAIGLSGAVSAVIALPLLPARQSGVVVSLNPDVGETIGWPALARTVAAVDRRAGGHAVILASNYGEAGAVDRYGPALGLPRAYSGHNAFAEWGPPPDHPGPVITIGIDPRVLARRFSGCRAAARLDNPAAIANDERGTPVDICTGTIRSWSRTWGSLRHLG